MKEWMTKLHPLHQLFPRECFIGAIRCQNKHQIAPFCTNRLTSTFFCVSAHVNNNNQHRIAPRSTELHRKAEEHRIAPKSTDLHWIAPNIFLRRKKHTHVKSWYTKCFRVLFGKFSLHRKAPICTFLTSTRECSLLHKKGITLAEKVALSIDLGLQPQVKTDIFIHPSITFCRQIIVDWYFQGLFINITTFFSWKNIRGLFKKKVDKIWV